MKVLKLGWVSLAVLVAGCAGGGPHGGRWVGSISAAPPCDAGRASLTIQDDLALFAPNEGTLVLRGKVTADGVVTATRGSVGADKKPYVLGFTAQIEGDHATGKFATPACIADVVLTRLH